MNSKQLPLYYHQEIVRLADQVPVAHELLLRSALSYTLTDFIKNPSYFTEHFDLLMKGKLHSAKQLLSKNKHRKIFINFTPEQIASRGFIAQLEWLSGQGIKPSRIAIEVTEGSDIGGNVNFIKNIEAARNHGSLIAIDDFGSGYSNMFYIPKIQPDIIKLDLNLWQQAFSSDIDEKLAGQRVVMAAVKFIKDIGAKSIIEGVETKEQSYFAIVTGADFGQGYYYHRPERAVPTKESLHYAEKNNTNLNVQVVQALKASN